MKAINTKQYPKELDPLAKEAIKYDSFEEFRKAFLWDLNHGKWWHVTNDPNFTIKKGITPTDYSSMAVGPISDEKPGLMITGDLEAEAVNMPDRKYAAELDLSEVPPKYINQVNRGFGNEVSLPEEVLDKVKVIRVLPKEQALKEEEKYQDILGKYIYSDETLHDFYNYAINASDRLLDPVPQSTIQAMKNKGCKIQAHPACVLSKENKGIAKELAEKQCIDEGNIHWISLAECPIEEEKE